MEGGERNEAMQPLIPVDVIELFPGERTALVGLLDSLSPEQWAAPTICADWSVKDVALHLLGDDVGRLSGGRDGFANPSFGGPELDLSTWDGLVTAIDRQNAIWVTGTRRISPPLLIELLRYTGEATDAYFRGLDLSAINGPVDWAGPEPAPVWLDVAREYTERWVHQQHIRDAVGQPGLKERRWFGPVLATFGRGLRRALQPTTPPAGTAVRLVITGEAGGNWVAVWEDGDWLLGIDPNLPVAATVEIDQEIAWRLFTRGVGKEEARRGARITGAPALADAILSTVSILANDTQH